MNGCTLRWEYDSTNFHNSLPTHFQKKFNCVAIQFALDHHDTHLKWRLAVDDVKPEESDVDDVKQEESDVDDDVKQEEEGSDVDDVKQEEEEPDVDDVKQEEEGSNYDDVEQEEGSNYDEEEEEGSNGDDVGTPYFPAEEPNSDVEQESEEDVKGWV